MSNIFYPFRKKNINKRRYMGDMLNSPVVIYTPNCIYVPVKVKNANFFSLISK